MPRRVFLSVTLTVAIGAAVSCAAIRAVANDHTSDETSALIDAYSGPMTIALSSLSPGSPVQHSWFLSVNSAGKAQLTIATDPPISREFEVTKAQLDQVRRIITKENFCALGSEYGQVVPDSSYQVITITVGEYSQAVHLHYLQNYRVEGQWDKLRQPARALRVWLAVRKWFDDPEASDATRYHQMTLDALDAAK